LACYAFSLVLSQPAAIFVLALLCFVTTIAHAQNSGREVSFTRGALEVPTYTFARSETVAPLFTSLENMGLYPYARLDRDSLSRQPRPVRYESLTLENEYLRVVILPELGGRIWSARDKIANREIFYYTNVIKPTGYNQRGGWPVGNLEVYGPYDAHMLTWPGEPWPWGVEHLSDGGATITLSHIDHFFRNKLSMSVTLRPGRALIELKLYLRNDNPLANRYLLWTNAGIAATDGTRFIYPMTRTIGHDSSELSTWPVVRDVDLSWYKNNQNMLGVFGLDLYDDFIAAYDYHADYGTICYTNRQLARGVKTWTWGTGEAARRQMESYTDRDGPYIEVQSGRFVWDGNYEFIEPGKSDGWTEYWYGVGGLGGLTTANRDLAIFFDEQNEVVILAARATGNFPNASLELKAGDKIIWKARQDLTVGSTYRTQIALMPDAAKQALQLTIRTENGTSLAQYTLQPDGSHPNAVFAADSIPRKFGPIETLTAEEAYQKGLAHEKFGETEQARQSYQAALAKDGGFTQPHLRLGLMALDRMQYAEALDHFKKVIERDRSSGEAHYHLAVIHFELGDDEEAQLHFSRLLPSASKFDQRDYWLGLLHLRHGRLKEAATWLAQAVAINPTQLSVREANAFLLRRLGRADEARKEDDAILRLDPTNAFASAEKVFLADQTAATGWEAVDRNCAQHTQGYLELATAYFRLSAWNEARLVLERAISLAASRKETAYPLLHYYRSYAAGRSGDEATARQAVATARSQQLNLEIFPFHRETVQVLKRALDIDPKDPNAMCLLGEFLYSRTRRDEAQTAWRAALQSDPNHFHALRDLGMALIEAKKNKEALRVLTRASERRPEHLATTILVARLQTQAGNPETARQVIERALINQPGNDRLIETSAWVEAQAGQYQRALELILQHKFEPRHQSYSLLTLYQTASLNTAITAYKQMDYRTAIERIRAAGQPPANLGVDDFAAMQSARLPVFEALLHQAAGNHKAASQSWRAAAGTGHPAGEEGLFHAIALAKTGAATEAERWFKNFLGVNEQNKRSNRIETRAQAFYLAGIYEAFFGRRQEARESFTECLRIDHSSLWAQQALTWLEAGLLNHLAR
jgi:Tfp pilus assembly protein PilF